MIDIEEHMPLLQDMASDKHVVELGVRDGSGSTTAFLRGAKKLTSYDITPLRPKHLAKLDTGDTDWEFIVGDSLEIEVPECDLLFIDTHHVYAQLSKELTLHGNKSSRWIVMHDTETFPEMVPAIDEFIDENPHWFVKEILRNNNGLTILERA